jgi:hypothetical protein
MQGFLRTFKIVANRLAARAVKVAPLLAAHTFSHLFHENPRAAGISCLCRPIFENRHAFHLPAPVPAEKWKQTATAWRWLRQWPRQQKSLPMARERRYARAAARPSRPRPATASPSSAAVPAKREQGAHTRKKNGERRNQHAEEPTNTRENLRTKLEGL